MKIVLDVLLLPLTLAWTAYAVVADERDSRRARAFLDSLSHDEELAFYSAQQQFWLVTSDLRGRRLRRAHSRWLASYKKEH